VLQPIYFLWRKPMKISKNGGIIVLNYFFMIVGGFYIAFYDHVDSNLFPSKIADSDAITIRVIIGIVVTAIICTILKCDVSNENDLQIRNLPFRYPLLLAVSHLTLYVIMEMFPPSLDWLHLFVISIPYTIVLSFFYLLEKKN
jgi:hypothetical protein